MGKNVVSVEKGWECDDLYGSWVRSAGHCREDKDCKEN